MTFRLYPDRSRLKRVGAVMVAVCTVAVFLACGAPSIVHLANAPADKLSLSLTFTNALIPSARVSIEVRLSDTSGNQVVLAKDQTLRINGVALDTSHPPKLYDAYTMTVPRAPLGGNYTVVYTDERGQQTTVVIPAAQHDLAITSPAANARVPIPQSTAISRASLTVRYSAAFDEATLPVPISKNGYRPPYEATAYGSCKTAGNSGTPASDPRCVIVANYQQDDSGSITITDKVDYAPKFRFDNLTPGSGIISVDAHMALVMPPGGFYTLGVTFVDETSIPITWV